MVSGNGGGIAQFAVAFGLAAAFAGFSADATAAEKIKLRFDWGAGVDDAR